MPENPNTRLYFPISGWKLGTARISPTGVQLSPWKPCSIECENFYSIGWVHKSVEHHFLPINFVKGTIIQKLGYPRVYK